MSWLLWLRVVLVTALLIPFVQLSTRLWAQKARPAGRHLRLIESLSLGGESRLHLVEVAGRIYLLSSGPQGSQVVDRVSPEAVSAQEEGVRSEAALWGSDLLEQLLGRALAGWVRRGLATAQGAVASLNGRGVSVPVGGDADSESGNPALLALEQQLARVKRLELSAR